MGLYKNKTKQELIDIIFHLEEQIKGLSLSVDRSAQSRFRELKSQSIFDTLPEMITVLDHSGNIIELVSSPSTNHLEGITSQEIVGSNIKEILPESAYYNIAENMKKVIETSKDSIANHRLLLNGEMHYYENQIFPLDDQYLLCICRDISKRYMAECINQEQQKEITRLNALMGAILDNIPVYLFIKDSGNNFRYLYFNKAFADNSGIPINKAVGKNDYEIFTRTEDMQKFRELDLKVLKEGELSYVEDYETANGDIRFIKTLKKTLRSSTEKPYIIGVSWDITDSKQAERTLVEALTKAEESDRLKSAFLANMSHEIRTPLNAIVGFSKLISEVNDELDKQQFAQIIETNSEMLLHLIDEILDISAIETGTLKLSMASVRLLDICIQLEQQYNYTSNNDVKLFFDTKDSDLYVKGDWDRITQVITNLLNNAFKFTSSGEIHFGFDQKGDFVEFYVKDTGIGIPAEKASKIFERFGKVDTFVQGTGLGLTICRSLIERMNGRIWLRSQVGKGTTFYFTMPCDN